MSNRIVLVVPKNSMDYLEEAYMLVKTVGLEVAETVYIRKPNPRYYLSLYTSNKIRSIIKNDGINRLIIYDLVKPHQMINLMKELRVEIWDRTRLILEIFNIHAGSMEAKLQIELAKIKHELPLIREYIRQAKITELPGFLGPGQYAIDAYYRMLRSREASIRKKLNKLKLRRINRIKNRREQGFTHVAITGYTSAGKTTLFNTLTKERKPTGPEAFTTLHPKTKRATIKSNDILFTDTVGFIRSVPVEIIEAFHATLAEVLFSDLVLLVVDSSDPDSDLIEKVETSVTTLKKIGLSGVPIIIALNKIDLIPPSDVQRKRELVKNYATLYYSPITDVVPVSALKGMGLESLRESLWNTLFKNKFKDRGIESTY